VAIPFDGSFCCIVGSSYGSLPISANIRDQHMYSLNKFVSLLIMVSCNFQLFGVEVPLQGLCAVVLEEFQS
jgi:hypothetical protein